MKEKERPKRDLTSALIKIATYHLVIIRIIKIKRKNTLTWWCWCFAESSCKGNMATLLTLFWGGNDTLESLNMLMLKVPGKTGTTSTPFKISTCKSSVSNRDEGSVSEGLLMKEFNCPDRFSLVISVLPVSDSSLITLLNSLVFSRVFLLFFIFKPNLPVQEFSTIVSAAGVRSAKVGAVNTFLAELAMSVNCVSLTPDPIPRENTFTFLSLSPREASDSSVKLPLSVVCWPSVITTAI